MGLLRSHKSTNVRIGTLLAAGAAASLCGCSSLRASSARPCEQKAMLVCERFAGIERCECTPRRRIDAWLMDLNGRL